MVRAVPHAVHARMNVAGRRAESVLRGWVVNTFGSNSQEAHDFGLPPPKPRVVSSETKAAADAKLRATRAARHTMGRRQGAAIKGTTEVASPVSSQLSIGAPARSNDPLADRASR